LKKSEIKGLLLLAAFIPFILVSERPAKVPGKNTRNYCWRKRTVVSYPVLNFEKKKSGTNKNQKRSKRNRFSFPV